MNTKNLNRVLSSISDYGPKNASTYGIKSADNKEKAFDSVLALINSVDGDTIAKNISEFRRLYEFFTPKIPNKPKNDTDWIKKAMAVKDVRYYLKSYRILDENGIKCLVATDGHRLHLVENYSGGVVGAYDKAGSLLDETDAGIFPDFRRVLPNTAKMTQIKLSEVELKEGLTGKIQYYSVIHNDKVISNINKKYWDDAVSYLSSDSLLYFDTLAPELNSILLQDGNKKAALMPLRV